MAVCSIAAHTGIPCNPASSTELSQLSDDQRVLVLSRSKVDATVLCDIHLKQYVTMYVFKQKFCCDPWLRHTGRKGKQSHGLRVITTALAEQYSNLDLIPGQKLCTQCRKHLSNWFAPVVCDAEPCHDNEPPNDDDDFEMSTSAAVQQLNTSLTALGESPIVKKRLSSKNYANEKLQKVGNTIRKRLRVNDDTDDHTDNSSDDLTNIIDRLKAKFIDSGRSEQIQILTLAPSTWTVRRVMAEFGATFHMARTAKQISASEGIMATPNPKPGKALNNATANAVSDFYNSDSISRLMPGKRDCVSMRVNGIKENIQKRLILCNLREAYKQFKTEHPELPIGFSKFAALRPKNVVLPGASGTHSVCVCTSHQNVKLMLHGAKLERASAYRNILGDDYKGEINYKHLLAALTCNPAMPECSLGKCVHCPSVDQLKGKLIAAFDELSVDEISYKAWVSVDRTNLETVVRQTDSFVDLLLESLVSLKRHDFIAKQQSAFLRNKKQQLVDGEVIVSGDFAENYSFVVQDAAQGYHWTNDQATIHPFVIYYQEHELVKHLTFAVISDCLTHDTVAVHCYQRHLIAFLQTSLPHLHHIVYFSDGAASQYKNRKNFSNLICHANDFPAVTAEWHFFATSHGKGPCDGVGGSVKRLAAKASLQRPYDKQIQTPMDLFIWADDNLPSIKVIFVGKDEIAEEEEKLRPRFADALTVTGTQRLHSFVPVPGSSCMMRVREYSAQTNSDVVKVTRGHDLVNLPDIAGSYITCTYDNQWWLAYVPMVLLESDEANVSFLHPAGPSPSFSFPRRPDTLTIGRKQILTRVEPVTATGRVYRLSSSEMTAASVLNNKRI